MEKHIELELEREREREREKRIKSKKAKGKEREVGVREERKGISTRTPHKAVRQTLNKKLLKRKVKGRGNV